MKQKQINPATSFEFIEGWFEKAANNAKVQGRSDSAALWADGLQHLRNFKNQRDELLEACKDLLECSMSNSCIDCNITDCKSGRSTTQSRAKAAILKAEGK